MPLRIEEFTHRPHVLPDATDVSDGIMSASSKATIDGLLLSINPVSNSTWTPTYGVGGRVTNESWRDLSGKLLKTIDYTYVGLNVSTEIYKVYASDGVTVTAQVTITYAYLFGSATPTSYTLTRDV